MLGSLRFYFASSNNSYACWWSKDSKSPYKITLFGWLSGKQNGSETYAFFFILKSYSSVLKLGGVLGIGCVFKIVGLSYGCKNKSIWNSTISNLAKVGNYFLLSLFGDFLYILPIWVIIQIGYNSAWVSCLWKAENLMSLLVRRNPLWGKIRTKEQLFFSLPSQISKDLCIVRSLLIFL